RPPARFVEVQLSEHSVQYLSAARVDGVEVESGQVIRAGLHPEPISARKTRKHFRDIDAAAFGHLAGHFIERYALPWYPYAAVVHAQDFRIGLCKIGRMDRWPDIHAA